MPYNPFNPLWILYTVSVYLPPLVAVVYGIVLCIRHRRRKPQTAIHNGTAIALLVASGAPTILMPIASWLGFRLMHGGTAVPFGIVVMQSVLLAMGLALLLRTTYLDEDPVEYDPAPPVYRNDDGPAEDG